MPNYGKSYTALKKRVEAEKRRHQKKGMSFGSCKCDELAEEAHRQAELAKMEGKFGKANAFGGLFWKSKPKKTDWIANWEHEHANDRPREKTIRELEAEQRIAFEEYLKNRPKDAEDSFIGSMGPGFGSSPRLWEFQGPFYNSGY